MKVYVINTKYETAKHSHLVGAYTSLEEAETALKLLDDPESPFSIWAKRELLLSRADFSIEWCDLGSFVAGIEM